VSKSCSDQANAKGLHGKARKKFRSDCKHNGGKAS
ncbi:MAG: PsiF family protein, partial [Xanthobacteraceae bacterium]